MKTTAAFKALVSIQFHNALVTGVTTYISAKNEADAVAKLIREGYEVESVRPVQLTHLGGEVQQ